MHVVAAAAGETGRSVVAHLLAAGEKVRGIVRKETQAAALRRQGAEAVIADLADEAAGVRRIVALSTIGAHLKAGTGIISTAHDLETWLGATPLPVTILHAASFMDNWTCGLPAVIGHDVLPSMLLPLHFCIPTVSAVDVGRAAAVLMCEGGGHRPLIELQGPVHYSPDDAAKAFSKALGKCVKVVAILPGEQVATFQRHAIHEVTARSLAKMYEDSNSGLIAFERRHEFRFGSTTLEDVINTMVWPASNDNSR